MALDVKDFEMDGEEVTARNDTEQSVVEREHLARELARLREELKRLEHAQQAYAQTPKTGTVDFQPNPLETKQDEGEPAGPRAPGGKVSRRRRVLKGLFALMLAALLSVVGYEFWQYFDSYETTDDAQIDGHLNPISSRVSGTVMRVLVDDTQYVKPGQLLVELDPRDFEVAVEKARADLAQAEAQVRLAKANYEAAKAKLAASIADNAKAQKDAARYERLFEAHVVSREQYEEQLRIAQVDAATVESDRASLASAEKDIAAKEAAVKSAQAALDQALLNLSYTKIVAPVGGVVGKRTVEVGEHVDPGQQLLAIVQLDDIWVTANFKETQVRRMREGQPVTIHVDAMGRDFKGYVEGLGGASGEKFSLLPPENATGNYVKVVQRLPVRIRFDPGQDADHRLRPGMSVEPTVWLR